MTWHESLLWVLGLVAAYAFATNLDWLVQHGPGSDRRVVAWINLAHAPVIAFALRGMFFLGVPIAAVALRVVSPADLGLVLPGTPSGTVRAVAMAGATLGAAWIGRYWFDRANGRPLRIHRAAALPGLVSWLALDAMLLEAHWALFRAALLSVGTGNVAFGVALAVVLLGVESWANPWNRAAIANPDQVDARTATGITCALSAFVFVTTRSSLLAWALHVAVGMGLRAVAPDRSAAAAPTRGEAVAAEPTVI